MKQHVNLSIDTNILLKAKKKTNNLSGLVESFLKDFCEIENVEEKGEISRTEMIALEQEINEESAELVLKKERLQHMEKEFKKKHPVSIKLGD